ncbi:uncharacterized protein LOC141690750 [Apium graveolens]|uniref:uncharacterized protein LOC141690750 n=1 Tax=Apium graveolens TaxID=4045 RepID=UPI003D7BF11A
MFPLAEVHVLEVATSDHLPLNLQLNRKVYVPWSKRFKFENVWLKEKDCLWVVQDSWETADRREILDKISYCCLKLDEWGGGLSQEYKRNLIRCRAQLRKLRSRRDRHGIQVYNEVRWEYLNLLEKQETYWKQCTKQFWLQEGDRNTRFFSQLFKSTEGDGKLSERETVNCVTEEENDALTAPVTLQEVKAAVFSMHPDKSPGIDGLNPGFFQSFWSIVGRDVLQFCQNFMNSGELPLGVNRTLVCLISKVKTPQGKTGIAGLKIDISKAYDRLEWGFIRNMMEKFGFNITWVDRVMKLVQSVFYSFLQSGTIFGDIMLQRGVRQGDPISPYIYIMCAEGLSSIIRRNETAGLLHGCTIARGAPTISHILFADDCYFFFRATGAEAVQQKLQGWQNKSLSKAGKVNLIKSAAQVIPNFWMSMFLIPQEVCEGMEKQMNAFWWGNSESNKGVRWMSWERLCDVKEGGGLGFKELRSFNLAMLAKQAWRLINNINPLVTQLMRARYYPKSDFLNAKLGANPSYVWRSIMESQDVVRQGCRCRIGDGSSTKIWKVPWLMCPENGFLTTEMVDELQHVTVQSLLDENTGGWDDDVLDDILNERDRELVRQIPLSTRRRDDTWFWLFDDKGKFTVKSCYRNLRGEAACPDAEFWRKLWNLKLPGKVLNLVWRACRDCLPTTQALALKRVNVPVMCPWCQLCEEDGVHVLFQCSFAREVWTTASLNNLVSVWPNETVLTVLKRMSQTASSEQLLMIYMLCWSLWQRRNDWVWNRNATSPFGVGVGCIIRDEGDNFLRAKSTVVPGRLQPREAEALSLKEALAWTKEWRNSKCIFKCDAKLLVDAVNGGRGNTYFHAMVEDCIDILKHFDEVLVCFAFRPANMVAHELARAAYSMSGSIEWTCTAPDFIMCMIDSEKC